MILAATFASALAVASPGYVRIPLIRSSRDGHGRVGTSSNRSSRIPLPGRMHISAKVGTPKPGGYLPDINVLLDTSSSNLWLPSVSCRICRGYHHLYDHGSSTSYVPNGTHFHLDYARMDGSVYGFLSYDTFQIGDLKLDKLEFAEATDVSIWDYDDLYCDYDGILGLGFDALAVDGVPTVMSRLIKDGLIDKPLLGISYNDVDENDGELLIGDIDRDAYVGDLHFTPVDSSGYWQFMSNEVWIAGGADPTQKPRRIVAQQAVFLSTTYMFLGMPQDHLDLLVQRIGAYFSEDGFYAFPCNVTFTLKIIINDKPYTLTEKELGDPGDPREPCLLSALGYEDMSGKNLWKLGHVFTNKYYTALDYGKREIGFAEKPKKRTPSSSTASKKKLLRTPVEKDGATSFKYDVSTPPTSRTKEDAKQSVIIF